MNDLTKKHCVPCEEGGTPMPNEQEDEMLKLVQHDLSASPGWILVRDGTHKIRKQFKFKNFKEAMDFVNKVAEIASKQDHHPDIYIFYNKVQLDLFTHAVGGLSENDFIMAAKINAFSQDS